MLRLRALAWYYELLTNEAVPEEECGVYNARLESAPLCQEAITDLKSYMDWS